MKFSVPEMSCSHCTASIEKSIKAKDPAAAVSTDLETRIDFAVYWIRAFELKPVEVGISNRHPQIPPLSCHPHSRWPYVVCAAQPPAHHVHLLSPCTA